MGNGDALTCSMHLFVSGELHLIIRFASWQSWASMVANNASNLTLDPELSSLPFPLADASGLPNYSVRCAENCRTKSLAFFIRLGPPRATPTRYYPTVRDPFVSVSTAGRRKPKAQSRGRQEDAACGATASLAGLRRKLMCWPALYGSLLHHLRT